MAGFAACADVVVGGGDAFEPAGLRLGVQLVHRREKFAFPAFEIIRLRPYGGQRVAVALRVVLEVVERFFRILGENGRQFFEFALAECFVAFDHFPHNGEFGHHTLEGGGAFGGNRAFVCGRAALSAAGRQCYSGGRCGKNGTEIHVFLFRYGF